MIIHTKLRSISITFDGRWIGDHGIGRFAKEIDSRLRFHNFAASGLPSSPADPFRIALTLLPRAKENIFFISPGYNGPIFSFNPYIITIHDLNHIDRPENSSLLKRIYYRFILKRVCLRAAAVMTVSDYSKKRIVEWSGIDKIRIFNVGNGVSPIFSDAGDKPDFEFKYILCVSNRRGHKNESGALQGFLKAGLPSNIKLVFTGSESGAIVDEIASLKVQHRVHFAGRLSEVNLATLYRGAIFLLFPSFYEGFGLPIVEAFASGTPVITSNVTAMPEIAGDAALLVDPNDINDIASAIEKLYNSSELRAELVQRGLKRVENFTWDAVADRVKAAVKAVDTDPSHPLSWN